MGTSDNCGCYNNGHKQQLHHLFFKFLLQNTKKNLCLRRWLSTRFTSSIPAAPETRMMNAEWFTKDHAHSVFMWTAHLDYGVANVQFDPVLSMRQQVQGG